MFVCIHDASFMHHIHGRTSVPAQYEAQYVAHPAQPTPRVPAVQVIIQVPTHREVERGPAEA